MLVAGIQAVHAGESLLAPTVTRRMIQTFLDHRPASGRIQDARLLTLTERERQTLDLIARGLSNAEIAETFVVSETTVKTHVGRVLTKLGVRDRVHAVIFAYVTAAGAPPRGRPAGHARTGRRTTRQMVVEMDAD